MFIASYENLAAAYTALNRFDEAQQRAEAALRIDPDSAEAHELLGGLFERKPLLTEAVREYKRELRIVQQDCLQSRRTALVPS